MTFDDVTFVTHSLELARALARGKETTENSLLLVFSVGVPQWTVYTRYLIKLHIMANYQSSS